MTLIRNQRNSTGIFSELDSDDDSFSFVAAEHAYEIENFDPQTSTYGPKIPDGVYTCQRGMHQLEGMTEPFETFEVTGVTGHTNLLFHSGNLPQVDSEGCILLGMNYGLLNGQPAVLDSKQAFASFMQKQTGVDTFQLTVT